jgi:hypothetical protein
LIGKEPVIHKNASILIDWKEFSNIKSAEAHCQIAMQQIPDLIIKFDTGVLYGYNHLFSHYPQYREP